MSILANKIHAVYDQYYQIGDTSYDERVYFYNVNARSIELLPHHLRQLIEFDHLISLFEAGYYLDFLAKVEDGLVEIIDKNIYFHRGEKIFEDLIFKKAASQFQIEDYHGCLRTMAELVKLEPDNELNYNLILMTFKRKVGPWWFFVQGACLFIAFILSFYFLVSFVPNLHITNHQIATLTTILISMAIFTIVEIAYFIKIYRHFGQLHPAIHRIKGLVFKK